MHGQQKHIHEDLEPPFGFTAASTLHCGTHPVFFICSIPNLTMHKSDYLAILATLVLTAFIHVRTRKRSRFPLPPGPKKFPILGNLFDFPKSHEWLTYAKLCKEYSMYRGFELFIQLLIEYSLDSNIIHLRALGLDFIILNSFDDAVELLEKRSSNYQLLRSVSRFTYFCASSTC